jgi:hypothetical protein
VDPAGTPTVSKEGLSFAISADDSSTKRSRLSATCVRIWDHVAVGAATMMALPWRDFIDGQYNLWYG